MSDCLLHLIVSPQVEDALSEWLLEREDVVIGSRYVPGGGVDNWPWHRRALSRFANFYARTLLRLPIRDCTAGFRGYRRRVLEAVDPFAIRSQGYSFLEEMASRVVRCGFSVGEVPIVFVDRRLGVSKIESKEIYLAAFYVLATALRPPPLPRPGVGHGSARPGAPDAACAETGSDSRAGSRTGSR